MTVIALTETDAALRAASKGGPILDQFWLGHRADCSGGGSYELNLSVVGPIGQEFIPSLPSVTAVFVYLKSAGGNTPQRTGSVQLNLRETSIDGPLVATATNVATPPSTGAIWHRFELIAPAAVVPGRTYVIELYSAEDRLTWVSETNDPGCPEESYRLGDQLFGDDQNAAQDYMFAVFGAPEPGVGPIGQRWTGPEGICGIQANEVGLDRGPLAQSFTPTSLELGSIAVGLQVLASESGPLTVNIRRGSPTGPLLAARSFAVTPPQHGGVTWFRFDFNPPRVVVPDTPYVIELADPQNRFAWIATAGDSTSAECHRLEYPDGTAFVDGKPLAVGDFLFATFESGP